MEERGSIGTETRGGVAIVSLVGEHDITNVDTLRAQLGRLAGIGTGGSVVVSLMQTTFLDSSIVHALFRADEKLGKRDRRLVLHVATASIVRRVLEVSGLGAAMPCTGDIEEAMRLAGRRRDGSNV